MKRASLLTLIVLVWGTGHAESADPNGAGYDAARWDPIHFKPAILEATDEQCLDCHREVLESRIREASPAGLKADQALAWYQTLDTYQGDQETFHRRHLVSDYATQVMSLKCNTCHLGNDPREETAMSHAGGDPTLIQRKHVEPEVCLMCHGGFSYQIMAVPGPWAEYGAAFQDNCLLCHAIFRTNRHRVNYLKADAIEALAKNPQAHAQTLYEELLAVPVIKGRKTELERFPGGHITTNPNPKPASWSGWKRPRRRTTCRVTSHERRAGSPLPRRPPQPHSTRLSQNHGGRGRRRRRGGPSADARGPGLRLRALSPRR